MASDLTLGRRLGARKTHSSVVTPTTASMEGRSLVTRLSTKRG